MGKGKDIKRSFDSRTGLFTDKDFRAESRSRFDQMVVELSTSCLDADPNYTVIVFDIDYFKAINDLAGHDAGNDIISHLGRLIQECKAEKEAVCSDFVGVFGRSSEAGDEFLIALPYTPDRQGYDIAEELRARVESEQFGELKGVSLMERITSTFGVRTRDVAEIVMQAREKDAKDRARFLSDTFAAMIKDADMALNYAKFLGKNRVAVFEKSLKEEHDNLELVHNVYFRYLCEEGDATPLIEDPFIQANPSLMARIEKHAGIIGDDIEPQNTRFAAALANRLYKEVQHDGVLKERFLEFCRRIFIPREYS